MHQPSGKETRMVDAVTVRLDHGLASRLTKFLAENPSQSAASVTVRALDEYLPTAARVAATKRVEPAGGQDEVSGREGYEFGISAGRALASQIGELISPVATELRLPDGRRATLRTAKGRNTQWGCLNTLLERIAVVLCAFTPDGTNFDVWEVDAKVWAREARNASPGHKLHNKLTLLGKSGVEKFGKPFGKYSI
jgi:predicted transcriptional regulator